MSNIDFEIDRLRLDVSNAAGQEHRLGPIAGRAAALFAARLDGGWSDGAGRQTAPSAKVNLQSMSDEEAAQAIADEWLRAMALKLVL